MYRIFCTVYVLFLLKSAQISVAFSNYAQKNIPESGSLIIKVNGKEITDFKMSLITSQQNIQTKNYTYEDGDIYVITCGSVGFYYKISTYIEINNGTLRIKRYDASCSFQPFPKSSVTCKAIYEQKRYAKTLYFYERRSLAFKVNGKNIKGEIVEKDNTIDSRHMNYTYTPNETVKITCEALHFNDFCIDLVNKVNKSTESRCINKTENEKFITKYYQPSSNSEITCIAYEKNESHETKNDKEYRFSLFFQEKKRLEIQDLHRLQQDGHDQYIYQYNDQNSTFNLSCSKNTNRLSTLKVMKGKEVLLNETIKTKIDYVFMLNKTDNGSEIKCLDEEIRNPNNPRLFDNEKEVDQIIIKLLYISPAREDDSKNNSIDSSLETSTNTLNGKDTDKSKGQDTKLLYSSIGLLVAFLIILVIVLRIQNLRKKKKREDKIHLQVTDSQIISQNTEPVTFNDTYTNPNDDNSYEDASLNLAIPQTYCTPYIGNGDVYAEPIPKNLRIVKKPVNYVNTVKPGSRTESRKKPTNIRYVNHTLPKQNVQVEEYVAPSDATYQDMYSEINS